MYTVVLIAKRPESHCEKPANSNLVKLWTSTRCRESLTQTPTSSNPPSRSQRRINVDRVSFDGNWATGLDGDIYEPLSLRSGKGGETFSLGNVLHVPVRLQPRPITFKANSYGRCFRVVQSTGFMETVSPSGSAQINGTNDTSEFLPQPRTEQGSRLYERLGSQVFGVSGMVLAQRVPRLLASLVTAEVRLNPRSNREHSTIWQKSRRVRPLNDNSGRSQKYNGFRPDRTGLRKTPSSWLPANVKRKDHPGFVLMDSRIKESPFLSRGL